MDTLRDVLVRLKNEDKTGVTVVKKNNECLFISYKQLYSQSSLYLHRLHKIGVRQKQEFIIIFDDLEKFIHLFWACVLGGIIPVPVSLEAGNSDKITNILFYCRDAYIFCSNERIVQELREKFNADRVLSDDCLDALEDYDDAFISDCRINKGDLTFIQFSSGSTSLPKGVKMTSHNLLCNIQAILKRRNVTQKDKFLSWMPLTHDMGLICFHLAPMFLGVDQILIPTDTFIKHPLLWIQALSDYKATVTGATNFCVEYFMKRLKKDESFDWQLEQVKHLMLGAEMISVDLFNRFLDEMACYGLERKCLAPGYGMAEAALCATLTDDNSVFQWVILDRDHLSIGEKIRFSDRKSQSYTQVMCVGKSLDNVLLRIVDAEKNNLEDDCVGIILIKGQNVTSGYYNNPEFTDETIDKDRWLNTGDIGFIHDHQLYITGRYKDMILYNGKNYYSNDIEEVLIQNGFAKINEVVVIGLRLSDLEFNDRLICILKNRNGSLDKFFEKAVEVKKFISDYCGVTISEVLPIHQMPKTTSGKIKRYNLKDRYIKREWKPVTLELNEISQKYLRASALAQDRDVESMVTDCFVSSLEIDIDPDESFTDYNLNSLLITKVYQKLDEKFPGLVTIADFYEYTTLHLLAEHIEQQMQIQEQKQIQQQIQIQ